MNRLVIIDIAPEITEWLDTDAMADLFDRAEAGYTCTICTQPGRLTVTDTATAVGYLSMLAEPGTAPTVRLAHHTCAGSHVRVTMIPPEMDQTHQWPAFAWLRPTGTNPRAMLVIAPRVPAGSDGDLSELNDMLIIHGFRWLTTTDAPLHRPPQLATDLDPDGRLSLIDCDDVPLWSGRVDLPAGWVDIARINGQVGVIVVPDRIDLSDPTRDHLSDLAAAAADYQAVAINTDFF